MVNSTRRCTGFRAVAHVGQRPTDDHAHGIVEIRLPELVFDVYREDIATARAAACWTIAAGTFSARSFRTFRLIPGGLIRLQF